MNDYKIPCTEEQTKKALKLGAPIERIEHLASIGNYYVSGHHIYDNGLCYFMPTAEEMIGWLENNTIFKTIQITTDAKPTNWMYAIYFGKDDCLTQDLFKSRKEATLSAIDKALEYLVDNKLVK